MATNDGFTLTPGLTPGLLHAFFYVGIYILALLSR